MKKMTWENPNRMHFESPLKTFNRQCRCICTGNQICDVVYSNYIRPYSETECNGFTRPPGHLQNYDLTKNIVGDTLPYWIREETRRLTHDDGGILYNFHHWNGGRRVDDGFVLTSRHYEYRLIKVWYINHDWRAQAAVDEAVKYITN